MEGRVDKDFFSGLPGGSDETPAEIRLEKPFVVILEADNVGASEPALKVFKEPIVLLVCKGQGAFVVDAEQLLTVAVLGQTDDALLADGGPVGQGNQGGAVGFELGEQFEESTAFGIISDDADAQAVCVQSGDVGGDGGRSSRAVLSVHDLEYLDGGLGADAKGVAVDVAVEHKIAGQQHGRRAQLGDGFQQVGQGHSGSCFVFVLIRSSMAARMGSGGVKNSSSRVR